MKYRKDWKFAIYEWRICQDRTMLTYTPSILVGRGSEETPSPFLHPHSAEDSAWSPADTNGWELPERCSQIRVLWFWNQLIPLFWSVSLLMTDFISLKKLIFTIRNLNGGKLEFKIFYLSRNRFSSVALQTHYINCSMFITVLLDCILYTIGLINK